VEPRASHLHTYFLFPFSIDKQAVLEDHAELWKGRAWFDGLDDWIATHDGSGASDISSRLGRWQRAAYRRFDLDSEAYENMAAFHPFVRRVFFDTQNGDNAEQQESLLNTYIISLGSDRQVFMAADDAKGRSARVEVTALRLFLFANGIGILSIGVEARDIRVPDALWINKMLRKVFPANQRQLTEGRVPSRLALEIEEQGRCEVLVEERFGNCGLVNYQPPLARTIRRLLYFTDYDKEEYAPVLDERMLVYSYMSLDAGTLPDGFDRSRDLEVLLSRFMYVDGYGLNFRYDEEFTREAMKGQVYRRWAHQGTYYACTSYSSVALTVSQSYGDWERPDLIVHRMFGSRYYMIAVIALFYRATLLDFSEQTALVSKRLYMDQAEGRLTPEGIRIANRLRADFLHFSNYWLFEELANKEEEMDHFRMQHEAYKLDLMKSESEEEIEKLNNSVHEFYEVQSTIAVNRLAVSSIVLGAGAVITGYFGMNFEREFGEFFFGPEGATPTWLHYGMIYTVTVFALAALCFMFFIIAANWNDYRDILVPGGRSKKPEQEASLRRAGRRQAG